MTFGEEASVENSRCLFVFRSNRPELECRLRRATDPPMPSSEPTRRGWPEKARPMYGHLREFRHSAGVPPGSRS